MKKNLILMVLILTLTGVTFGQKKIDKIFNNKKLERWEKIESFNAEQINHFIKKEYHRLDSIIEHNLYETEYISSKELFFYTDFNRIAKYEYYYNYSDDSNIGFDIDEERVYEYDDHQLLTVQYITDYHESKSSKKKLTYSYINGLLSEKILYYYLEENNQWKYEVKSTYIYNDDGHLIEEIIKPWNDLDSSWDISSRYKYNVNENGDVTEMIRQDYYNDNMEWYNDYKTEYTYYDTHIIQSETEYIWGGVWEADYKYEKEFDDVGNIIQVIESNWSDNAWVFDYKGEIIYEDGILNSLYFYQYHDATWFIDNEYFSFTIDINSNLDLIYPNDFLDNNINAFKYKIEKVDLLYSEEDGQDNLVETQNFYWSKVQSSDGVSEEEVMQPTVYPNPTSDFIRFKLGDYNTTYNLKVTNIEGKTVLEKQIDDNSSVSVSNLEDGIYLFSITDNNNTYNGKFVKK